MLKRPIVSIFGSSRLTPSDAEYFEAMELGKRLALAGFDVITGGYAGAMEAVSRGAKENGARTIGITADIFSDSILNPWVDEELRCKTLHERLEKYAELSSGFVAVRGGIGTLTEVGLIWNLLFVNAITDRPLILLGRCWEKVLEVFHENLYITKADARMVQIAGSPEEVIAKLKRKG